MTWWYESGDSCYGRGDFGLVTSRLLLSVVVISHHMVINYHLVINYHIVTSCPLVIHYHIVITCHNCKIKMNYKSAFKCITVLQIKLLYAENEPYSLHLKSLHLVMYRLVN